MKTFFSLLFVITSLALNAQVPEPHMLSIIGIGGNGSENISPYITKTADGGFIAHISTSSTVGSGNIDTYCAILNKRDIFIKYSKDASIIEWKKCYGHAGDSFLMYMFPTHDGGTVLGGMFKSTAAWGWLITKHDAADNVVWQRNYSKGGGSLLRAMIATDDGGYVMMGESYHTDTNVLIHYGTWETSDIWVLKVDSNGYKVWSKVIGGSYEETGFALASAPGGGCYVMGTTQSSDYDCTGYHAGGQDAYLARLDVDGNILWHKCLGGSGYEASSYSGCGVADGKGGVLMAVSTTSTDGDVHHHINQEDYWVLNVDSTGGIAWENCYDAGASEYPAAICKSTDGSIWINGWTSKNYDDVYLVRANNTGLLEGSAILSSNNKDHGSLVYPLPEGLIFAGGTYFANNGTFSSLPYYGVLDVFVTTFAPWPVSISEKDMAKGMFRIYPNPAGKELFIELNNKHQKYTIKLNNMEGRQIYKTKLKADTDKAVVDVEGWAKGPYYIQLSDDEGGIFTEKIIIE